jgi:hypothetical protein
MAKYDFQIYIYVMGKKEFLASVTCMICAMFSSIISFLPPFRNTAFNLSIALGADWTITKPISNGNVGPYSVQICAASFTYGLVNRCHNEAVIDRFFAFRTIGSRGSGDLLLFDRFDD